MDILRLNNINGLGFLNELFFEFQFAKNDSEKLEDKHKKSLLDQENVYLFVALVYRKVIGYCLAYKFPSLYSNDFIAYLFDIEVLPGYRKSGIGKQLINSLNKTLREDGVEELWLGTDCDNNPAKALYQSTGGVRSEKAFYEYTYNLEG